MVINCYGIENKIFRKAILILFWGIFSSVVFAQQSQEELAKASQNPLANMMSFPFQNNTNFNTGQYDRVQNILNFQPVLPFFGGRLITRTIIPLLWQPMNDTNGTVMGLSDIQFTAFYSPRTKGVIIGIGPIISFPSGSASLGTQKWCAGPSIVLLGMPGHWVIGVLANNIWSFAGNSDRDAVNQFLAQYFVNYNLPKGWYLTSAPIITANWNATKGNQWTIPFGLGAGKIVKLGKLPVNLQAAGFYNAVRPSNTADWTLRVMAVALLPTSIFKNK